MNTTFWLKEKLRRLPLRLSVRAGKTLRELGIRKSIVHIGVHGHGNAGDRVILDSVRVAYNKFIAGSIDWQLDRASKEVSPLKVAEYNREARCIVVGGGGLFLADSQKNANSGWMWNCPVRMLQQIEAPIIVFGIGFNRFRGQNEFPPIFREHINELVERSAFISLRERESISLLGEYLSDETLKKKIVYQPCPTTVLRYLYPSYANRFQTNMTKCLVFTPALDRADLRFGNKKDEILTGIAKVIKLAEKDGWQIKIALHTEHDGNIAPWLIKENINFSIVNLMEKDTPEIIRFYQQSSLTISMRLHGLLIPFGLGNPIIPIISHKKIESFLNDIDKNDWGVDVFEADLIDKIFSKIQHVEAFYSDYVSQITESQQKLWNITQNNINSTLILLHKRKSLNKLF